MFFKPAGQERLALCTGSPPIGQSGNLKTCMFFKNLWKIGSIPYPLAKPGSQIDRFPGENRKPIFFLVNFNRAIRPKLEEEYERKRSTYTSLLQVYQQLVRLAKGAVEF